MEKPDRLLPPAQHGRPAAPAEADSPINAMPLKLTSSAFADGKSIPRKHTCDGDDISPPLSWTGAPPGTESFALICDDPDAPSGTFVHWVLYGLPGSTQQLAEQIPPGDTISNGARQGMTDFRHVGYGGPCPPSGKPHRYRFRLYALDADPGLKPRATKAELLKAMEGHIREEAVLMGTYQRDR
jgi:Raf kinase inhibitor-like YbhB/YbcL family protein